jgi:trk system potassium uptake protein TrkH
LPRPRQIATAITLVYVSLTAACGVAYWLAGMSVFDALCHALSTIPTGGFSNHDRSFAHFDSPMVDAIGVIFMLIGGMPIVLLAQSLRGGPVLLWRSSQVRAFLGIVSLTSSLLALWLWWDGQYGATEAVRHAFFNVTSIVTTTGLASADYTLWAPFASYVFFVLTFVGACTGSTSGGIKIFRFQVMLTVLTTMLKRLVHPRAIFPREYEDKALTPDVIESVFVFVVVFIATVGALALVLGLTGLDFVTSISAAATAVANVGPGLGPIVGPVGNFAPLPEEAKWALSFGMLVGRLELFTVLVLLMPSFWRD